MGEVVDRKSVSLPPGAVEALQALYADTSWRTEALYCRHCGHRQPHLNAPEEHKRGCARAARIERAMRGPRIKLAPMPASGMSDVCPVTYPEAREWLKRHNADPIGEVVDNVNRVRASFYHNGRNVNATITVRTPKITEYEADRVRATREAICMLVETLVRATGEG